MRKEAPMIDQSETRNPAGTKEGEAWSGKFGSQYSERNQLAPPDLDESYRHKYGVTRSALNQKFLADIPRSASILEVGCNLGNQLLLLQQMGFENLTGIEIHKDIVKGAQTRVPSAKITEGSALNVPFPAASFDFVFTSGLLIHIGPKDLSMAMSEIHRCAKEWIWALEYYSPELTEVPYRGNLGLLWKADYARLYQEKFPDLEIVLQEKLKYLESDNVDTMFLLRKNR
jgi:pseudaminic acid biosynthesis-associated methylase